VVVVRVVASGLAMPGEIIAAQGFVTRKLMKPLRQGWFRARKMESDLDKPTPE